MATFFIGCGPTTGENIDTGNSQNISVSHTSILKNYNFESDSNNDSIPDSWSWNTTAGCAATSSLDKEAFESGYSVKFTNPVAYNTNVSGVFISDGVSVEPGKYYLLEMMVKANNNSHGNWFGPVYGGGSCDRFDIDPGTYDWVKKKKLLRPAPVNIPIGIQITVDHKTDGIWIDNVVVRKLSEEEFAEINSLIPNKEKRPYETVMPISKNPTPENIFVYDRKTLSNEERLLLTSLQGLVNRRKPCILQHQTEKYREDSDVNFEKFWLNYYIQKGFVKKAEEVKNPLDLLEKFKDCYNGVVIYDPNLAHTINIATMISSVKNCLVASPELADKLNLPVVEDLRGRWKKNGEMYEWAYKELYPKMNHHILASFHPESYDAEYVRDYIIAHKIFCFWAPGFKDYNDKGYDVEKTMNFVEKLLRETPANIPVLGWGSWKHPPLDGYGLGELEWESLISRYGKFTACSSFSMNLTFHSGVRVDPALFKQKQKIEREKANKLNLEKKVYVSMNMMESGDSTWFWQRNMKVDWFGDEARGTIPLGYNLTPLCLDVIPGVMLWYYENLTENDEFFSGSSGLTYMHSLLYAEAFNKKEREEIYKEYVDLTAKYLKRMDTDIIEVFPESGWGRDMGPQSKTIKDLYGRYIKNIKGLKAVFSWYINALYGEREPMTDEEANYLVDGVPVFHAQTKWTTSYTDPNLSENATRDQAEIYNLTSQIEGAIKRTEKRPLFIHGMALSWTVPPTLIKKVMEHFDDDVIFVTPSELVRLYTMHKKSND